MKKTVLGILLCAGFGGWSISANAGNYTSNDARYVTTSRNSHVINYVVCLANVMASLEAAQRKCADLAMKIPDVPTEPSAEDIVMSIMECGFRPGDGSEGCDSEENPFTGKDLIAFTTEPNDLGSGKDFLKKYPLNKCKYKYLTDDNMIYSCFINKIKKKFLFNLGYSDSVLVLTGASLKGERPNLNNSLIELQKELMR